MVWDLLRCGEAGELSADRRKAGLIEAVALPITGLLRRGLAFGTLALINTSSASVTAIVTILLAFAGFSYMSVAWAMVAGAVTKTLLSFYFRLDLSILRPTLRSWRSMLSFGGYTGASYAIDQTYRRFPNLPLAMCSAIGGRAVQSSARGVRYPGQDSFGERHCCSFSGSRGCGPPRPQLEELYCELWGILLCSLAGTCLARAPGLPRRLASPGSGVA